MVKKKSTLQPPEGVRCVGCEAFKGVVGISAEGEEKILVVKCQPPLMDTKINKILLDPLFKGGGAMVTGLCVLTQDGYDGSGWPLAPDSQYQKILDPLVRRLVLLRELSQRTNTP